MPRQKNTKPTFVYWLFDMRSDKIDSIAPGWGEPFYAGKTVSDPDKRLYGHRSDAVIKPFGKVSSRIVECGDFIRIQTMEIVSADQDWCERERYWISTGQSLYPGKFVNVSAGGTGTPGIIQTPEWRANITAGKRRAKRARIKRQLQIFHGRARVPSLSSLLNDL